MNTTDALITFCLIVFIALSSIWFGIEKLYITSFIVFLLFQFIHKQTLCKKKHIINQKKLTLGYGGALWYYKNYLDRILEVNGQSVTFSRRIKEFMSYHKVKLPEKLYILCPRSCKVQKYIDTTRYIDRCRELIPFMKDNSGIVKREYNITVYKIQHPQKSFRCAIEYAQPLKSFLRFKEMGRIDTSELHLQREEFFRHLKQFLRDANTAHKLCELVEFDDETEEIHDVLYNVESIQRFLKETEVL